jgi:hypothetical protein
MEILVFPLAPKIALPEPAPATTRPQVPPGYGVQEQCLPFTAATALGYTIQSPISFGLCVPDDVPAGAQSFRSPVDRPSADGTFADERVFYVQDNFHCRFEGNAFTLDPLEISDARGQRTLKPVQPGVSFFDREDQLDLFKLHLPYVWKTPADVDLLFLPLINRSTPGLIVLSGLVEADWYGHPVNLVLRKPDHHQSIHVAAGAPIAQAIFLQRSQRRPALQVIAPHARLARDFRARLADWYQQHAEDPSAYKKLARSNHGRVS